MLNNVVTLKHGGQTTKFIIPDGFYLWNQYMNTLRDLMDKKPVPKLKISTGRYTGKVSILSGPDVELNIPIIDQNGHPNMNPFNYLILKCENLSINDKVFGMIPVWSTQMGDINRYNK